MNLTSRKQAPWPCGIFTSSAGSGLCPLRSVSCVQLSQSGRLLWMKACCRCRTRFFLLVVQLRICFLRPLCPALLPATVRLWRCAQLHTPRSRKGLWFPPLLPFAPVCALGWSGPHSGRWAGWWLAVWRGLPRGLDSLGPTAPLLRTVCLAWNSVPRRDSVPGWWLPFFFQMTIVFLKMSIF